MNMHSCTMNEQFASWWFESFPNVLVNWGSHSTLKQASGCACNSHGRRECTGHCDHWVAGKEELAQELAQELARIDDRSQ